MYQFSRGIYRELTPLLEPRRLTRDTVAVRLQLLRSCERSIERLATDRHYFARPTRTIFNDVRMLFPVSAQQRVLAVVTRYVELADAYIASLPPTGIDAQGQPITCRAMTRRGTPCQRAPLPRNGYCPSHQHLADTEEREAALAA